MANTKKMKHNDPKAFKDTFWNLKRIERNLKLSDVSKYLNMPYGTIGTWFCGKVVPSDEHIEKLCSWFTDILPDDPITYDEGKRRFELAHITYEAEHDHKLKAYGVDMDNDNAHNGGKKECKTEIGRFIRDHGFLHKDLAQKIGVAASTLGVWVLGKVMPRDGYICDIANVLNEPDISVKQLFAVAYADYHKVDVHDVFDFSHDLNKTDKSYVIEEATKEEIEELIDGVPHSQVSEAVDKALNDRMRFTKWSELYNQALLARIDIVAHLMYLYTQWDYNMWDAIEALAQERNDIPFWVLRTMILEAERVQYFGEIPGEKEDYYESDV